MLQPSICFHRLHSPTSRLCPSPLLSALPAQPGCHSTAPPPQPPAVTPWVPSPSRPALAPHCRAAAPLQSRREPGCHSPRARQRAVGWTVLRAAAGLRCCGPRRQGWARAGSQRTIQRARQVAAPAAGPLGEVSAGGARRACSGARCRAAAAAAAEGGARSGLQAECAPTPEPRAAAPPRTPPSASGARRERKRGARTPPRDPGRSARTHARPGSAPSGEVGARLRRARGRRAARPGVCAAGRAASWAGPAGRAAGGAELGAGKLRDEVHPGAAQVLKCSSLFSSAPPPILCSLPLFLNQQS